MRKWASGNNSHSKNCFGLRTLGVILNNHIPNILLFPFHVRGIMKADKHAKKKEKKETLLFPLFQSIFYFIYLFYYHKRK